MDATFETAATVACALTSWFPFAVVSSMTDAVAVPTAGTLGLPLTWDNTKTDIAAGTVLRVTGAGGVTMPAGDVYVLGFRVA